MLLCCVFSFSPKSSLEASARSLAALITLHLFIGRCASSLWWTHFARGLVGKTWWAWLCEQTSFCPLEAPWRTSALEHLRMSGNSPSPERDVTHMFFKHFRVPSRAEPSRAKRDPATFAPRKNFWGPAAGGSHYCCHHPIKRLRWVHSCWAQRTQ